MLHWCFVLELRRFTGCVLDSAANENQRSRGRFPLSSANTKNHKTGFGKKPQGFKKHALVVFTDEFSSSSFLQSRGRETFGGFFLI